MVSPRRQALLVFAVPLRARPVGRGPSEDIVVRRDVVGDDVGDGGDDALRCCHRFLLSAETAGAGEGKEVKFLVRRSFFWLYRL